jgi:hypothetical protein
MKRRGYEWEFEGLGEIVVGIGVLLSFLVVALGAGWTVGEWVWGLVK